MPIRGSDIFDLSPVGNVVFVHRHTPQFLLEIETKGVLPTSRSRCPVGVGQRSGKALG